MHCFLKDQTKMNVVRKGWGLKWCADNVYIFSHVLRGKIRFIIGVCFMFGQMRDLPQDDWNWLTDWKQEVDHRTMSLKITMY